MVFMINLGIEGDLVCGTPAGIERAVAATAPRMNEVIAAAPMTRFSETLGLGLARRPSS